MQKKSIIIISLIAVAFLVAGCTAIFEGPAYDAYFSEKTVKNIRFMDKDAGGLKKGEVEKLVDEEAEKEYNVIIDINGTDIELNAFKSGITFDKEATVDKIMNTGKKNLFEAMKARKGVFVEPVYTKDLKLLEDVVTSLLSQNNVTSQKYVVDIKESTADYTILTDSLSVDYENLGESLIKACNSYKSGEKITATFREFSWPDAEELRADFDIPVQNAEIKIENGVKKYNSHVVGRKIDFDALKKNIDEKNIKFSVSYVKIKPSVYTEDLGDELFPDLLGKFTTYYSEGNVGRSINVKLAASKINGYIMNVGDVFSFNQVVGRRDYANGFKDAAVYSANGVENGVGGGICQVSSTLYPAVLYADLKIVERRNHSYTVAYAAPGLDATVSYGSIDFRFSNNKKNPIKLSAIADNGAMTVRIYGTKENNNIVELDAKTLKVTPREEKRIFDETLPIGTSKVTNSGFDGVTAQVYKHIKSPEGAVISSYNLGVSNYIALNKIIKYNDGGESEAKTDDKTDKEDKISEDSAEKPPESENQPEHPESQENPQNTENEQTQNNENAIEEIASTDEKVISEEVSEENPDGQAKESEDSEEDF